MTQDSREPVFLSTADVKKIEWSSFPEKDKGNTAWRTLFTAPDRPTTSLSAGVAQCPPGGFLALHKHAQAELYYVLSGTGTLQVEAKNYTLTEGATVWIPGDAEHGVFCDEGEQVKWLYVFPEGKFEDVIYRFSKPVGGGLRSKL